MISTSLLSSDAFGASDVVDTIVGVRLRPFVDEDAKKRITCSLLNSIEKGAGYKT